MADRILYTPFNIKAYLIGEPQLGNYNITSSLNLQLLTYLRFWLLSFFYLRAHTIALNRPSFNLCLNVIRSYITIILGKAQPATGKTRSFPTRNYTDQYYCAAVYECSGYSYRFHFYPRFFLFPINKQNMSWKLFFLLYQLLLLLLVGNK